ncbi:hypothetical protein GE061_007433 [Apolygus lucorum]|uniref:Uncharacterized protein n=1 Tax=Apolygus lucorum TaxID=248454 RepID=A0A8S9WRW4_APOLU|nr:hypothetical protein GE061_007433 [Apolygus lucorum]
MNICTKVFELSTEEMGEAMETDVVSQLHQLSEKKLKPSDAFKEFNVLVRTRGEEIARDLSDILESFNPPSNIGKIFKVKLIDKYRQAPRVVQLLQCDDTLYVAQALKCTWFFEDIDNPVGFVNETIPNLSLVTRMKVINKYAAHLKNSKTGDVLYQEMKTRYGVKNAQALLPCCSENFIRNELPNLRVYLPPNITLALYKKYPSLTTEYIKYLGDTTKPKNKKYCALDPYESTFTKLAQNNLSSFLSLFENPTVRVPFMKLGRRPTKKLLKADGVDVLKKYRDYDRILVEKTFFKRLSLEQYKKLFVETLFPSKMADFCSSGSREITRTLRFVKEARCSDLILSAFKEKYGVDMASDEVLQRLDGFWIDFLPAEARYKWCERRIPETTDPSEQARLVSKLPVVASLPRLKKLIESQSDPKVRANIVAYLVGTLIVNQDSKSVSDLFAYLVKRFRNEVKPFRSAVRAQMSEIGKLYLEVDDWTSINDFINIVKLNGEADFKGDLRKVFKYQIQRAFDGKHDLEAVLKNYVEFELCDSPDLGSEVVSTCDGLPCHKLYLQWLLRESPNMTWKEDYMKLDFCLRIFESSSKYNKDHEDSIEVTDWVLDVMESALNSEDTQSWKKENILRTMKEHPIPRFQKYVVEKVFPEIMSEGVVCHLLRHDPDRILQHIQLVTDGTVDSAHSYYRAFFKKCRLYDSFGIASELTNRCLEILTTTDPDDPAMFKKPNAVRVLALLLSTREYAKVVSQFYPDEKHVEEYSDEVREKFEVQKAVCASFVDVSSPLEFLPVIRKFTEGDFLKLVVGSLVKTCLNVPETQMLPLLEKWMNCPVSLRKHFLRLMNDLAPSDYRCEIFVNVFKTEKNVSLRLLLFNMLRKSFLEIPGDDTFAMYKSIINQLTVEDEEALKKLIDIDGFDDIYVSPYLELLWQLVDTKFGEILKNGKNEIRSLVNNETLLVLENGFCDTLMTHEMTSKLPNETPVWVGMYLLWAPSLDVQQSRLDKVIDILRSLIVNLWDVPGYTGGPVFPIRGVVRAIVGSICELSRDETIVVNPTHLLTGLKTFLSSVIKPTDLLREAIAIDLATQLHTQRHLSDGDKLTKVAAPLLKSYIDQYGHTYGYTLIQALSTPVLAGNKLVLASEFLSYPESNHMYQLLALEVLKGIQCSETDVPTYKTYVNQLSQSEHPSVQVAVNEFFHALATEV